MNLVAVLPYASGPSSRVDTSAAIFADDVLPPLRMPPYEGFFATLLAVLAPHTPPFLGLVSVPAVVPPLLVLAAAEEANESILFDAGDINDTLLLLLLLPPPPPPPPLEDLLKLSRCRP